MKYRIKIETITGEVYCETLDDEKVATQAALSLVVDNAYSNYAVKEDMPYIFIPHHQIKKVTIERI